MAIYEYGIYAAWHHRQQRIYALCCRCMPCAGYRAKGLCSAIADRARIAIARWDVLFTKITADRSRCCQVYRPHTSETVFYPRFQSKTLATLHNLPICSHCQSHFSPYAARLEPCEHYNWRLLSYLYDYNKIQGIYWTLSILLKPLPIEYHFAFPRKRWWRRSRSLMWWVNLQHSIFIITRDNDIRVNPPNKPREDWGMCFLLCFNVFWSPHLMVISRSSH